MLGPQEAVAAAYARRWREEPQLPHLGRFLLLFRAGASAGAVEFEFEAVAVAVAVAAAVGPIHGQVQSQVHRQL